MIGHTNTQRLLLYIYLYISRISPLMDDLSRTIYPPLVYIYISRISPLMDDLSLTIYPPLVWEEAKEAAWKLKQTLEVSQIKEI